MLCPLFLVFGGSCVYVPPPRELFLEDSEVECRWSTLAMAFVPGPVPNYLGFLWSGSGSRAFHPVFNLYANRTLAHIEARGGLLLLGGSAGLARYVHFGRPTPSWRLRAEVDGKRVTLPATAAKLQVPLHSGQAAHQAVYLSLKSPTKSSLKISVSGKSSVAVPLAEGWQLVTVPLPADSLRAGENTLSLTFAQSGTFALAGGASHKAAAAVEWVQVGGQAPAAGASVPKLSDGSRLLIPGGGALHYYAFIPKGGALSLKGEAGACALKVTVDGPQPDKRGQAQPVSLDGSPVSLGGHAGEHRRIGLRAEGYLLIG